MTGKKSKIQKPFSNPPVWEWIFAALGVILVGGAIGSSLFRAFTQDTRPPSFEVSVVSITPAANGHLVTFRVKNTGSQTAAGLNIEGNLMRDGEKVEISTVTLTYAPPNSVRQGGIFFTKDPNDFKLEIRALGYEKP